MAKNEGTIIFKSMQGYYSETALLCSFSCISYPRRIFYITGMYKQIYVEKVCHAYFNAFKIFLQTAFKEGWSRSLLSAYYPLLLSGSSLIVCFWAEVFHLRDIRWDKPQFLSKSFLAFVVFNIMTYSLLLAEFIMAQTYSQEDQVSKRMKNISNYTYL